MNRCFRFSLLGLTLWAASLAAQDAGNDASFGLNGYSLIGWDPPGGVATDRAQAMVIQADGRIVLAGNATVIPPSSIVQHGCALTRLHPNGSIDTSFGEGGRILMQFPAPIPLGTTAVQNACVVHSLAIDGQDRIIIAAWRLISYREPANGPVITLPHYVGVARFTPAGLPDTSFAGDGRMQFNFQPEGYEGIQPDQMTILSGANGRLFVIATVRPELNDGWLSSATAVARITAAGSLDSAYSGNGRFVLPRPSAGAAWRGSHAAIFGDRIVIAGYTHTETTAQIWLGRLTSGGSLDLSFGLDLQHWYVLVPRLPDMTAAAAAAIRIDNQGRILLAGTGLFGGQFTETQPILVRLHHMGILDGSFGSGGYVVLPMSYAGQPVAGGGTDVAFDAQGRVVLSALVSRDTGQGIEQMFATARVDASGALDASYWAGGRRIIETDFMAPGPRYDVPAFRGLAITPTGRILIGGTVRRGYFGAASQPMDDFAVLALRGAPLADAIFANGFQCQAGAPGC